MKTSAEVKENKMGTMKIPYLLFNMACPLTISLMVQAMYNIIDSLFVSRLGENALAAISLAVTLQNLMSSTASGLGVGINALVTSCLGEKNKKQASAAALNGILIEFRLTMRKSLAMVFNTYGFVWWDLSESLERLPLSVCCRQPGRIRAP